MTTGAGAALIGGWFGTGADRGIALVFCLTGALGVVLTLAAFASRSYRQLSDAYAAAPGEQPPGASGGTDPAA
jgi:DHA3 family multidrug efflux protein-like MFS transporter